MLQIAKLKVTIKNRHSDNRGEDNDWHEYIEHRPAEEIFTLEQLRQIFVLFKERGINITSIAISIYEEIIYDDRSGDNGDLAVELSGIGSYTYKWGVWNTQGQVTEKIQYRDIKFNEIFVNNSPHSANSTFSRLGASLNPEDYKYMPIVTERISPQLLQGALDRLNQNYPHLALAFQDSSFAGFWWAKYMSSAAAIIKVGNEYGFLLDENLRERLTQLQPDSISFLFILIFPS